MAGVLAESGGAFILRPDVFDLTGLITNTDLSASAAIAASKCQRAPVVNVFQSGTAADETILAFFVRGTSGTIVSFTVSNVTACAGASTVTVDLQINGVTALSSVVTLNSGKAAFSETEATLSVTALSDGDYVTVVINATQSGTDTLATGVFAQIQYNEDYAS